MPRRKDRDHGKKDKEEQRRRDAERFRQRPPGYSESDERIDHELQLQRMNERIRREAEDVRIANEARAEKARREDEKRFREAEQRRREERQRVQREREERRLAELKRQEEARRRHEEEIRRRRDR